MRVTLNNFGRKVGYLDFEVINYPEMLGQFERVYTVPRLFGAEIERQIKTNPDGIVLKGGHKPKDLSGYWDGVYNVLLNMTEIYPGFTFVVPPQEDPFNVPSEEKEGRVY